MRLDHCICLVCLALSSLAPLRPLAADGAGADTPVPATNSAPDAVPIDAGAATPASVTPPSGTATNAPPDAAGIRFDFAGMPYSEAIQRFCQMAGKPLIADTVVEGALTFSDPKPYTYGEALDTLNLILATKSVMLIEDDRYLRLVPFKALSQMPLKLIRGLENVGDVRPGELVTVVLDLKNLDAGELSQPISAMLSSAGSVASLSRGRGLIITDRLANIQRVRQLLDQVDTASPVQRQVKTFALRNVSGTLMSDLLNRTFGIATAPKRTVFNEQRKAYEVLPPDPTDYVTAIFAEASNTLVLFGPSERIDMAGDLIARFESDAGAAASEIKVFYPQMPVEELAEMVRQAIPGVAGRGDRGRESDTRAKVITDRTSNRLIVTAPAIGQLDAITALIRRLDPSTQETPAEKAPDRSTPQRELRVVDLKSGSAQALTPMLRDALTDLTRDTPGPNPMSQVRIQAAPMGNRILLTGAPAALDDVLRLIEQLDTVSAPAEVTRVFKLRQANAGRVAGLIMGAMGGYDWRRRGGGGAVLAAADDRSNSLIVAASEGQMKMIEQVIEQLEAVGAVGGRQLKILELTNNSAATVAGTLARLFAPQVNSYDPTQRVALAPAPNDRALVLEADESMMARLEEAVRTLDTAAAAGGIETRVVEVKSGSAQALAPMLNEALYQFGRDGRGASPFGRVQVQSSPVGNRLLLAGTAEALDRVETLVAQLDSVPTPQSTRVFKLKNADARQVANMVLSTMGGYESRRRGGGAGYVAAAAEERSNCVVVSAPDSQLELVEDIINRLDEAGLAGGRKLEILPIDRNSAASIAAMVTQMFYPQMRSSDPDTRIALTAAPDDRALVIEAGESMIDRLRETVQALDVPPTLGGIEVRTYALPEGRSVELAEALNRIFADPSESRRRWDQPMSAAPPAPRFEIDSGSELLMVAATADQFERIEKVLDDLRAAAAAASQIRTFRLQHGDPAQVVEVLQSMLLGDASQRWRSSRGWRGGTGSGEVRVAAAPALNAVVVQASPEKLALATQLIRTLDSPRSEDAASIQTVRVEKAQPEAVAAAVTQTLATQSPPNTAPRVSVTAVPGGRSLLLSGPEAEVQRIAALIRELDQDSPSDQIETRVFQLEHGSARELSRVLTQLIEGLSRARPRFGNRFQRDSTVTIAADERTNSLLVSGSADSFKLVEQLLVTLDQAPQHSDRQVQFYWLKNARAFDVALKAEALFAERPRAERPLIEPDSFSNSLTIVAKPADLLEIESVVLKLDEAARDTSLQVRMIPLTDVPVERMAAMLTNLYSQLNEGQVRLVDRLPSPTPRPAPSLSPVTNAPAATPTRPDAPAAPDAPPSPAAPPEVVIAVDKAANALIASGPAYELDHISSLVYQLSASIASPEFEIRQFRLKEADPVVVARVLNELFKPVPTQAQGQAGQPGGATPRRGADGRREAESQGGGRVDNQGRSQGQPQVVAPKVAVVAESRTHSVIVRARPADFALLESIIEQLDEGGLTAELAHRLVPLEHVTPERVLPLLRQMLTQLTSARPGEPAAIAGDPRSRGIFLVGRQSVLDRIEALIHELDTSSEFAEIELRTLDLKHAQAPAVAGLMKSVLRPDASSELSAEARQLQEQISRLKLLDAQGRPIGLDLTQPIKIVADPAQPNAEGGNRLVIGSTPGNLDALAAVVALLDTPSAAGAESLRVFPLTHADASSILQVLNDLSTRAAGAGRPRPEDRANVSVDERTNTLLAAGAAKALERIAELVEQLDRELPDDLRGIRILPLTHADATTIASSLQRLLDERARPRGGGRRMGPSSRVAVIPDARSNSLLISGGPDGFDLVQTLVAQLDQPGTSLVGQVRLIPLEHSDAGTLATTLSDLFNRRYQAARTPDMQRNRPVILADPRSNSLLVAAGVDDNQAIDALLVKLDRPPENPSVELSVLGLEYNDSARVAVTIRSVFAARLRSMTPVGQQPAPSDRVEVEADTLSNALVISASKPNLELVRELVAKLDAEPVATGGLIETFTLEHADVQRVSTLLRSLLDQGLYRPGLAVEGGRRSRRDALALATDPRSNTLIVSASPENLLIVKELIRQLDTADFTGASDIRLFALKRARASHLATVLEQFFRARRASETAVGAAQRSAPVTVTADDRTNTLLITGGKESFDAVERMIEQLDTDMAMARTNFRVYELRHTTATKLQATLQRLFTNRPPRIQGQPPEPVTVIADGWANALIIGASDDDLAMVASLIEKLDTEQPAGGAQVQVFQMAKADARRVQQTLQSLFRGSAGAGAAPGAALVPVVLDVDERLNAIIVSAGETDLKRIADLVKKLDTDQVARVAEIRIFPLQNGRAVEMALVLNNVLNNNPRALTEASPNRQSLLQFITKTQEGERLITSALKEGILIVPDSRANSLVVSAPLDYMALLSEVISHLDATAPTMAQIKVFHLKNADARQMAQVLTSLFRLQRVGAAGAGQQSVQYVMPATTDATGPEGEAPAEAIGAVVGSAQEDALSVTVDFRTNSLLVGGTEHYVALATQIIATLDSTPAQERTAKVYRLKNARSQAVEASLRTFLQQDLQRIMSILGPSGVGTAQNILDREVSIVSETNSNSLLISASPRYFKEVQGLVEELDQPQPQVLIQVLLAEVTLDSTTQLGVEWDYTSDTDPVVSTGTDFGQRELLQDYGGYWSSVTGSNYRFLVRALQNQGRLEVLSRPQILTADNQEATINIGQSVPVVQSTQVTPQGGTVSAIEYRDVGVMLTVTPRISPDGYVKMDVAPSISDLSSSKVTISKGEDLPIINQRTATTTVTVKSGQSVLIGGLIGTIDDERTKKVPLLGDIPGLGVLFRSKSKGQTRKELLVVLTPQILLKGEGEGRSFDAQTFTEEELRGSTIQGEFQRDPLQRRVLDPLLPPKTLESQTPQ